MKLLHVLGSLAEKDGGPPMGVLAMAKVRSHIEEVVLLPASGRKGKMIIEPGQYGNLKIIAPPTMSRLLFPDRKLRAVIEQEVQKADLVMIHTNWRYHFIAAAKACIKYNKPFIVNMHGNLGRIPRKHKAYLKMPYFYLFEKKYFDKADAVRCFSQKEYEETKEFLKHGNFIVASQPVDEDLLNYECDENEVYELCPNVTKDSKIVLYLGRICWIKQIPMLVEAFIKLHRESEDKNIHLIIAGPHEEKATIDIIKSQIATAKLKDKIHLPGMIKRKIKASFLKRADLFVQPSIHENFGISVAEAICFGVPCIVNHEVALSKEIQEYGAGISYNNDPLELCAAMKKLLDDKAMHEKCKNNALKLSETFKGEYINNQVRPLLVELARMKSKDKNYE